MSSYNSVLMSKSPKLILREGKVRVGNWGVLITFNIECE